MIGNVEALLPPAAIDNRGGGNDGRAGSPGDVDGFTGGTAGRNDIFDYQDLFARCEREAATQPQLALLAFGKDGADPKGASDLLADHDAAQGWREHDLYAKLTYPIGNRCSAGLSLGGMLKDQCGLKITRTMEARSQAEMAFEKCSDAPEPIEDRVGRNSTHGRRVYLWHIGQTAGRRT